MSFVGIGLCGGLMGVVLGGLGMLAGSRSLATAGTLGGVAVGDWLHFSWLRRAKAGR